MFGPHLIIDGSACNTQKLADRILIEQVLSNYPSAIGMTKIGGPYMVEYQAPDPTYSGVSGIVVIAESHIAIHTFPELDYFTLDIFSCRDFDPEAAIAYIEKAFEVKHMDRMLVQRGLSFHGPHHGNLTTTQGSAASSAQDESPAQQKQPAMNSSGKIVWPTYGVTADYGTYGENAEDTLSHQRQYAADVIATTRPRVAVEPVPVNPTASISGLLDRMSSAGGQARALGSALASWEGMVRDHEVTIVLALSTPVMDVGLREVLVYAAEQHYVDTVILSARDLFSDLYESLGYSQYTPEEDLDGLVPTQEGHQAALACFSEFVRTLEPDMCSNSRDLWRLFGEYLPAQAPRKGLLQAASAAGVSLFTPDLGTSTLGTALLALRTGGLDFRPPFDLTEEVAGLARLLSATPRLGVIRVGAGSADALIAQARRVATSMKETPPTLSGTISVGTTLPLASEDHHVAISAGADLVLPLVLTGLAQRAPGLRRHTLSTRKDMQAVSIGTAKAEIG